MDKIVVLGGYGEIGSVITTDLSETAKGSKIVVAGRNKEKAEAFAKSFKNPNITGKEADVANEDQLKDELEGAKVLINATNYYNNLNVMEVALASDVNYIDLGGLYHVTLKQLRLNKKFEQNKLIAVIGCGSTPGITNIMVDYGAKQLDKIDTVHIQFGDKDYTKYNYPFIVPYSMYTLFDEFTKDAAIFSNGEIKFVEALSGEREIDFPEQVGRIKCFYSLHSELATIPENLKSKGIKNCSFRGSWDPEFIKKVKFLIESGLASEKKVKVNNAEVSPRDVTVKMLNRFLPPTNIAINDIEFLRTELSGSANGKAKKIVMYCKTTTNKKWNIPAGSWDTGVPASIVAQMLLKGKVKGFGVLPPDCGCINPDLFFKEIEKRGMKIYREDEREI